MHFFKKILRMGGIELGILIFFSNRLVETLKISSPKQHLRKDVQHSVLVQYSGVPNDRKKHSV